ncbi:hypothetical protein QMQ05_13335 [Glutamicibacter ectropisis]|uniref:Uncharacterized protein n=1 Tax=Glutamicibacter ectropisis TaxID=3046593 RepID=A0AAU6WDV1_9MICC
MASKSSPEATVYVVWGEQSSPYPDLEHFEPIIGIVVTEQECIALEEKYPHVNVSWEERKVSDAQKGVITTALPLYLTHTTLEQYDVDNEGNLLFGIMDFPRPSGLYFTREAAEHEAPDEYLHLVRIGEIDLHGVGELLD